MKTINKILTVLMIISVLALVLTASIVLPFYCRFFYYLHIEPLGIEESSGLDREQIEAAYDGIIDYTTLGKPFSTGGLPYTEEGESHFADVKKLFDLDLIVLLISLAIVAALAVLSKTKVISLRRFGGFPFYFYSGAVLLALMALAAAVVLINPDGAFVAFHQIFFPGKQNWIFNPETDRIITILPQQFFINAGMLIVGASALVSAALVALGVRKKKDGRKNS